MGKKSLLRKKEARELVELYAHRLFAEISLKDSLGRTFTLESSFNLLPSAFSFLCSYRKYLFKKKVFNLVLYTTDSPSKDGHLIVLFWDFRIFMDEQDPLFEVVEEFFLSLKSKLEEWGEVHYNI